MSNGDYARVNHVMMMDVLKSGPMNVQELAAKLGRSSPWDLEDDVKVGEATFRNLAAIGISGQNVPFTVFPARERARYGFPDIIPVEKLENPKRRKRAVRNPDAKVQKQYWPIVALGDITPADAGESTSTYDGRHDEDVEFLRKLLNAKGFEYIEIKGRMVRGGSGIYISLATDKDVPAESSNDAVDTSGIVGGDHVPVPA